MTPGTFAAVFAALYAAHMVADHWVQTEHQAAHKGDVGADSWRGRRAALAHVATYTACAALALAAVVLVTRLDVSVARVAAGLAVSAATHYWADRRWTLRWLMVRVGHGPFAALGGPLGGAYLLDQSWHIGWLFIAALVMA